MSVVVCGAVVDSIVDESCFYHWLILFFQNLGFKTTYIKGDIYIHCIVLQSA